MSALEFDCPLNRCCFRSLSFWGPHRPGDCLPVRFPNDLSLLKYMVAFVWCLDFGHTVAIFNAMYIMTVVQYGHPRTVPDSLNLAIILNGFIGPMKQVAPTPHSTY
ncbi:hypothetical protein C8R44DRAFT_888497 [Mycena epipterygia]|nr:hypothetical protein C8R44DRAFT_888497 [Mycena epipterygia]